MRAGAGTLGGGCRVASAVTATATWARVVRSGGVWSVWKEKPAGFAQGVRGGEETQQVLGLSSREGARAAGGLGDLGGPGWVRVGTSADERMCQVRDVC